eukprot:6214069-Prymnesium_polylepis.1
MTKQLQKCSSALRLVVQKNCSRPIGIAEEVVSCTKNAYSCVTNPSCMPTISDCTASEARVKFGPQIEESILKQIEELEELEKQEKDVRKPLPDYVKKLILGYELRTYYFEIIECFRKLAIVCMPVFFRPSGSVSQLIFGLMVCFLTYGAYMMYHPYNDEHNDQLAQLCQV